MLNKVRRNNGTEKHQNNYQEKLFSQSCLSKCFKPGETPYFDLKKGKQLTPVLQWMAVEE